MTLRAGAHPKFVSERLGHATIAITLDTYSHASPALQEEAAERIAELVFAGEQARSEGTGQVLSPARGSVGSRE